MKDLKELAKLLKSTQNQFTKLTFEATVDTGFEQVALEECCEKFGNKLAICRTRGRVFFNSDFNTYQIYKKLRSVDHVYVLAGLQQVEFTGKKESDLDLIKKSVGSFDWEKALTLWKEATEFCGVIFPTVEQHNKTVLLENLHRDKPRNIIQVKENELSFSSNKTYCKGELEKALDSIVPDDFTKEEENLVVPRFRVTCHRVGDHHSFGSMESAAVFGGELHDRFHWLVDLSNYDLEVYLSIQEQEMYVGLTLNKISNHHRNIHYFGPTTLRATVCYNMLRLCNPQIGDVIMDPLCGGGSIPIEGHLEFKYCYFLGGDCHEKAVERAKNNVKELKIGLDVSRWDVTCLPLRSESVDVVVSDLPFGKRSGSKSNNKLLYKRMLNELARVVRLETGRAVFLTYDKTSFNMAYAINRCFWRQTKYVAVNIGGLDAGCFVLCRTNEEYYLKLSKNEMKKLKKNNFP